MPHSHLHLNITLIRRTNEEACDPSSKAVLSDVGKHFTEEYHVILVRKGLINALLTCFAVSVLSLMHINSRHFTIFVLQTFWRVTFLSAVTYREINSAPQ
jgi:hypothetical protein